MSDAAALLDGVRGLVADSLPEVLARRRAVRWKPDGSPVTEADILLESRIADWLAARLPGPDAEARAALLISQVLGLFMGRFLLRNRVLVTADAATLVRYLQPVLQVYVDGLREETAG